MRTVVAASNTNTHYTCSFCGPLVSFHGVINRRQRRIRREEDRIMDSHIQKKYEVEKRLGKGAYGIVWKATSKRLILD